MENQNQDLIQGNEQGNTRPAEKKGLKAVIGALQRKYDAVRYSKTGKAAAKLLTGIALLATGKVCYDKGKASVKPTVVTIERIQESEVPAEETPAEESAVEETV